MAQKRRGRAALWATRLPNRRHDPKDIITLRRKLIDERRALWAEQYDGAEMPRKLAEQIVDAMLDEYVNAEQCATLEAFFNASHETPTPPNDETSTEEDDEDA